MASIPRAPTPMALAMFIVGNNYIKKIRISCCGSSAAVAFEEIFGSEWRSDFDI